tara:strand:- start:2401 stop:3192 length:792 start_codon:yes stop_codon:yes gene_type:complete
MKKFIMIFAAVAMVGAVVVGLINKKELEGKLADLKEVGVQVRDTTAKLGEAEDKRDDAVEKEVQAKDGRNQAAAAVEGVKQNLKIVARSLEDVTAELKKVEIEQKEIDLAITKQFPDGNIKTAEDLNMSLTMLKDSLTENQNKKAELNAQLTSASQAKQTEVAKVKEEEKFQVTRAEKLSLNSLVATVIAVNKEWGFVMVNAGRVHGVSADASLLVKRGSERVARLRIVNLESSIVVADVVDDSSVSGINVQPGDKVIFETLN